MGNTTEEKVAMRYFSLVLTALAVVIFVAACADPADESRLVWQTNTAETGYAVCAEVLAANPSGGVDVLVRSPELRVMTAEGDAEVGRWVELEVTEAAIDSIVTFEVHAVVAAHEGRGDCVETIERKYPTAVYVVNPN